MSKNDTNSVKRYRTSQTEKDVDRTLLNTYKSFSSSFKSKLWALSGIRTYTLIMSFSYVQGHPELRRFSSFYLLFFLFFSFLITFNNKEMRTPPDSYRVLITIALERTLQDINTRLFYKGSGKGGDWGQLTLTSNFGYGWTIDGEGSNANRFGPKFPLSKINFYNSSWH